MKKLFLLSAFSLSMLFSCKKDTVEKIVEVEKKVEVEVPGNPFKTVAKNVVANGYGQPSIDYYTPLVANMKKFVKEEGVSYYGYYIYYGNTNYDLLADQVNGTSKTMFVLGVTDWNVKVVYNLGSLGNESPTNRVVIRTTAQRPNLVPTNANFYTNELCGFITKDAINAL